MDEIWAAFALAVVALEFQSGPMVLRPDEVGQVGAFPFDQAVHIVTAYNPGGLVDGAVSSDAAEQQNRSRHRELGARLGKHDCIPSVGSAIDGGFAEPGFAVLDIDFDVAVSLAGEFGQRAIYRWTDDRLLIVGVDEPVELELGWSLSKRGMTIPALLID